MKLRTKIIWISCIALVVASVVTEMIIWMITYDNKKDEALLQGYQKFYEVYSDIDKEVQSLNYTSTKDSYKQYFNYMFKNMADDYNICFAETKNDNGKNVAEEVYNNTILTYEELKELAYTEYQHAGYIYKSVSGNKFIIYKAIVTYNDISLNIFRVTDITYLRSDMLRLAAIMALITCIVVIVTIIFLNIMLRRLLSPLQRLNETANLVAKGKYDIRVNVARHDEVGTLAENINKMAEAVELRTNNLRKEEEKKTLFMGNLTHELKTPLTAISGYAQTLLSVKVSKEDEKDALLYIYNECGRLERLTKKMMKLLELDKSGTIERVPVAAAELFENVNVICSKILKDKDITLDIHENGEIYYIDKDLMMDVLVNLVDNAVKASHSNSTITLSACDKAICVEDNGCGIPEEQKEKILEPFYMIDKSRSRKSGGAGLGLALTVLILKQHNAVLDIESEEGKGCKITVKME